MIDKKTIFITGAASGIGKATAEALESAAPKVQAVVGSQVRLKYTPVLEFRVDPSIAHGARISKILHDLETEEEPSDD